MTIDVVWLFFLFCIAVVDYEEDGYYWNSVWQNIKWRYVIKLCSIDEVHLNEFAWPVGYQPHNDLYACNPILLSFMIFKIQISLSKITRYI